MKRSTQWLGSVGAIALALTPAMVAAAPVGTAANSTISNTATVDYSVGGVGQTRVTSAADIFTVDRKVDVVVTAQDTSAVLVVPGQTDAVTTFSVTNNSNATMDFLLSVTQQNGGAAKFTGEDVGDAVNSRIYVETNGTPGWQPSDTLASSLASVASGDSVTVYVVADSPLNAPQGSQATVILTAQAASGVTPASNAPAGTAGTGGTALAQTPATDANGKNTMETVFADAQAESQTGDGLRDGKHAARSDYRIDTANLAVAKYSRIVSDPVSGTTEPRAIPGAVVEYCIVVTNSSSTVDATAVTVNDKINTVALQNISEPITGGTFDGANTCTGGTANTWTIDPDGEYRTSVGTVARNTTTQVRFQATIR